jgi:hypothetical protein
VTRRVTRRVHISRPSPSEPYHDLRWLECWNKYCSWLSASRRASCLADHDPRGLADATIAGQDATTVFYGLYVTNLPLLLPCFPTGITTPTGHPHPHH